MAAMDELIGTAPPEMEPLVDTLGDQRRAVLPRSAHILWNSVQQALPQSHQNIPNDTKRVAACYQVMVVKDMPSIFK